MSENTNQLRLGIPKGSLQETTQKLDPEIQCILIRPQEMARYVGQGILDCAITGLDWILENDADVAELADLKAPWPNYGVVRWVLAAKDDSPFHTVRDLEGRRIATEAVGMTRRFPLPAGGTLPSPVEEPANELAARAKAAWARLIRKVYEVDPLECPKCKGPMRVIALIDDPAVVRRILDHLGLWAPLPTERSPPLEPASWPRHVSLPLTYHPLPDIA